MILGGGTERILTLLMPYHICDFSFLCSKQKTQVYGIIERLGDYCHPFVGRPYKSGLIDLGSMAAGNVSVYELTKMLVQILYAHTCIILSRGLIIFY